MKIGTPEPPIRERRHASHDPLLAPLDELPLANYLELLAVTLEMAAAPHRPRSGETDPEDRYGDFA